MSTFLPVSGLLSVSVWEWTWTDGLTFIKSHLKSESCHMGFQFEKLSENIPFYEALYLTVMDCYKKFSSKSIRKLYENNCNKSGLNWTVYLNWTVLKSKSGCSKRQKLDVVLSIVPSSQRVVKWPSTSNYDRPHLGRNSVLSDKKVSRIWLELDLFDFYVSKTGTYKL